MRHIIAFEGRTTVPTQFLEHGSLKWDDKPLPVTWMGVYSDINNVIGTATDIQRDDAGVVTAEIKWNDPTLRR